MSPQAPPPEPRPNSAPLNELSDFIGALERLIIAIITRRLPQVAKKVIRGELRELLGEADKKDA